MPCTSAITGFTWWKIVILERAGSEDHAGVLPPDIHTATWPALPPFSHVVAADPRNLHVGEQQGDRINSCSI